MSGMDILSDVSKPKDLPSNTIVRTDVVPKRPTKLPMIGGGLMHSIPAPMMGFGGRNALPHRPLRRTRARGMGRATMTEEGKHRRVEPSTRHRRKNPSQGQIQERRKRETHPSSLGHREAYQGSC